MIGLPLQVRWLYACLRRPRADIGPADMWSASGSSLTLSDSPRRDFAWDFYRTYQLRLTVAANHLSASVDGAELTATDDAFDSGGVALLIEDGRTVTEAVHVRPYPSTPTSP